MGSVCLTEMRHSAFEKEFRARPIFVFAKDKAVTLRVHCKFTVWFSLHCWALLEKSRMAEEGPEAECR